MITSQYIALQYT